MMLKKGYLARRFVAFRVITKVETIATGITGTNASSYPFQRKTFYAKNRLWAFYSDGTNIVCQ